PPRLAIATVFDEGLEVAIAHQIARDGEPVEPDAMTRPLVVEGETIAAMADFELTAWVFDPSIRGWGSLDARRQRPVLREQRRPGRLAPERVKQVSQHELLMLLLVLNT